MSPLPNQCNSPARPLAYVDITNIAILGLNGDRRHQRNPDAILDHEPQGFQTGRPKVVFYETGWVAQLQGLIAQAMTFIQ
jgi:hypothetical protein